MRSKNHGMLIVFSGLPGTGKTSLSSRLAKHFNATYIRMDAIVLGLKSETYDPALPEKCYRIAHSLTSVNLGLGNTVVTDSINPTNTLRAEWGQVAKSVKSEFVHIEVICSDKEEHRLRLAHRTTTLPGLIDPTWEEVGKLEYQEWNQDRILLETSKKSIEATFDELLLRIENEMRISK